MLTILGFHCCTRPYTLDPSSALLCPVLCPGKLTQMGDTS